ncbi:hypothetical protein AAFF_G00237830 [Aldrovandia affinis]|uniref:Transmembrane protein 126A n=1 Tax=Aldrovandia affinis TaxID=143900 RepID=A0AAD7RH51_9TELE|nr:hypothetical protein AAFF_G00237830 [Aldrovandia affinis]
MDTLHIISDGPITQHHNKTNCYLMSQLPFTWCFKNVTWNFSEKTHGKGAPDGVGGMADVHIHAGYAQKMSAQEDVETRSPKSVVIDLLLTKFERLPDIDKKLFTYGPLYLGFNGAFAGLIANSFFRRLLNVTQGRFTSGLPMAVLPFLTTVALYHSVVSKPLLSGDLDCPSSTQARGALVGVLGGGVYPILLALPVNAGLASRYSTAAMPEKGKVLQFMVQISKPVFRKMAIVLVLQAFFGIYLSTRHFAIYMKLREISVSDSETEDL